MPIPEYGTPRRRFEGGLVFDENTLELAEPGQTGQLYATREDAEAGTNPVQVYDLNGSPLNSLTVGSRGAIPPFLADLSGITGFVSFGSVIQHVVSITALVADQTALASRVAYLETNGGGGGGGVPTSPDTYPAADVYPPDDTY